MNTAAFLLTPPIINYCHFFLFDATSPTSAFCKNVYGVNKTNKAHKKNLPSKNSTEQIIPSFHPGAEWMSTSPLVWCTAESLLGRPNESQFQTSVDTTDLSNFWWSDGNCWKNGTTPSVFSPLLLLTNQHSFPPSVSLDSFTDTSLFDPLFHLLNIVFLPSPSSLCVQPPPLPC